MARRTYDPARDVTKAFLDRVATWIEYAGEVFVLLRYLEAAGAKDYAFCHTFSEFESIVQAAPPGTDIEVFRRRQLPIRGVVTETFIPDSLAAIPDGAEYMIVSLARRNESVLSVFGSMGDTHEDLTADLTSLRGSEVALGLCPDFSAPDSDDLTSASKGGVDGAR